MNDKPTIMSFYENWVDLMEMCNPEEWYQLCQLMTGLRFKSEDVNPKTIENIKVQMAWNLIRPSIKKSNRDQRYNETKRNKALQEVSSTEFDIPNNTEDKIEDNIEDEIKAILSPSNDKEVEQPQSIVDNASESLKIAKNEVKQNIPLRIAASEDIRPTEKLQELINTDDNFCTIYNRCINYIADYKLNPGDFVKSNSKNMAFSRLERLFEESGIPFNSDTKNFINNDVDAKMNSLARQEKIA